VTRKRNSRSCGEEDGMGTDVSHASRGNLLDAAWQVAKVFRTYGTYGTQEKAAKALRRRCPAISTRRCDNALVKAIALHDAAATAVAADVQSLLDETDVLAGRFPNYRRQVTRVRLECPGFYASTCREALSWVFYQCHLR
jgi:hypothetical protein